VPRTNARVTGMIIRTDGSMQMVEAKNGHDFQLEELNRIVGGYIEIVRLPHNLFMVLNEQGKLIPLAMNPIASLLYGAPNDYIAGDVLVCADSAIE